MKDFLVGVVVGAAGALWFTQTRRRVSLDRQFSQMQDRANQVLNESRRILEETRHELSAAFQAGKQTVQETTGLGRPPGEAGGLPGSAPGENPPPSAPPSP